MKKKYITPEMLVIQLKNSASLLAGSPTFTITSDSQDNDDALGRESDFDFEDEEY